MARRRGWLNRVSPRLLGDKMARVIDMCYDLMEYADSLDPLVRRYLPIAVATCLELSTGRSGSAGSTPVPACTPPST